MATGGTRPQQAPANQPSARTAPPATGSKHAEGTSRSAGYGLPCAKCHLYYPADLEVCPTCHHNERVSPVVPRVERKVTEAATEAAPDSAVVEQEREEFLRQFKSQLLEAHADIANTSESVCTLGEHEDGESSRAEVCKACHDRLQERLDVCEAALHLELKEAAQIIYDAVWSDPSDPSKTYQNAAGALLAELRKRAGISSLPFQPLDPENPYQA